MKSTICVGVALCCAAFGSLEVPQGDKQSGEPLADKVHAAITKGIGYLKSEQGRDGRWKVAVDVSYPGGSTALALLALLNAGVKADDPAVSKGLEYLRTLDKPTTYVRALQTMVLVEAGHSADLERIRKNVTHLLKSADNNRDEKGNLTGWGYDRAGSGNRDHPDNSNTQYALLALWVARQSGVEIDKKFWEDVRDFYTLTQYKKPGDAGGWTYDNTGGLAPGSSRGATLTMSAAGLCGLFMAQTELSAGREKLDPIAICGIYQENAAIKAGLDWVSTPPPGIDRFTVKFPSAAFYNLYGIERLGRLSGQRFLGAHDWYREGCEWLVENQNVENGSWLLKDNAYQFDQFPTLNTSFALLFLSKGRVPVLVSKLAHGDTPRQSNDQDWNRRRNDLRHLVDFASINVFNKMPLAWQTFDMRRQSIVTPQQRREVTADLLQSPILYITGHQSLTKNRRLTDVEKGLLKEYVDNGGFILAVACCGAKDFSDGFGELCQELWPNNELTDLELDHPIWTMRFPVKPGAFGLKGIQQGCKTVAVLSTENLCGFWEINRRTGEGEGETAFRLGANVIAYATGLEPPKPRLTLFDVALAPKDFPLGTAPRGYFQVGQLISKPGEEADWKPAPQAMSKLMQHMREATGLDAVIKTANVPIDHKDLAQFKFLYMHGRRDFKFSSKQLERLRFNLKHGALLLADACCGKEAFDKGFRQFIGDLFPREAFPPGETPKLVPILPDDLLFSKELNGAALTDANIQGRVERGKPPQAMRPALEGVKIGNRWAVIYSKYDIGCALEKHQSADCLGYTYDSALRLGRAAVLYELRP